MKLTTKLSKQLLYYPTLLILASLLIFPNQVLGQSKKMSVSVHFNIKVDTTKLRVYDLRPKDEPEALHTVVLRMRYGESEILNPEAAKVLNEVGCIITGVEVVYTDFRKQDVQDLLNKQRLSELYFLCPGIFTQSMVQWKYVEQLGYATENDAAKLFHGIVVKYMKVPVYKPATLASMKSEIKTDHPKDTSFFKLFRKSIRYKDELVCVDLTGSMSPYYMQVLQWLCMKNSTKTLGFAFFNDGDTTPDYLKRMGKVGGIYSFKTNSIDTIAEHAYRCTTNGYGGDAPENNIEAILDGVKKFPETKEIIILVDNWADMRDYSMMSQVKLPVKVVVCGTEYGGMRSPVNTQYLDLARNTGGSIYTIEEELEDLGKKREGDEIFVGGATYIIRGGKFVKKG